MNGTQDQTKSESAPNVNQLDGTQKNQRKCNCGNCKICLSKNKYKLTQKSKINEIKNDPIKYEEYKAKRRETKKRRFAVIKSDPELYEKYKAKIKENKTRQFEKIKNDPIKYEEYKAKQRKQDRLYEERLKLENPELYKEKRREDAKRHYNNAKARNPEKVREQKRINQNKYYHRSAKYRIRTIFGTRFREFLNGKGGKRLNEILDYSLDELKQHIEAQFKPGMTWDNHGKWWHIDHIIPLSYFNITDINDPKIKTAWALKNLRPIWAYQNLSKNNKLDNTSKIHLMDIKIEVLQQFLDNFEVNAELTRKIQERKCGKCD